MKKLLMITLAVSCAPLIAMEEKQTNPELFADVTAYVTGTSGFPNDRVFANIIENGEKLNAPLTDALEWRRKQEMVLFGGEDPIKAVRDKFPIVANDNPNMTPGFAKKTYQELTDMLIQRHLEAAEKRLPKTPPQKPQTPEAKKYYNAGNFKIYIDSPYRDPKKKKSKPKPAADMLSNRKAESKKKGYFHKDVIDENTVVFLMNAGYDSDDAEEFVSSLNTPGKKITIANLARNHPLSPGEALIVHDPFSSPNTKSKLLKQRKDNIQNIVNNS